MNVRVELIKLNIRACVSNSTPGGPLSYSKTPAWKFQVFEFDGRESQGRRNWPLGGSVC